VVCSVRKLHKGEIQKRGYGDSKSSYVGGEVWE